MIWIWLGFVAFVLFLLALDLGAFHRKAHAVGLREALAWSAVWAGTGLAFGVFVYFGYENQWLGLGRNPDAVDGVVNDGQGAALKYLTGYVVEKSLSVDNIFVIAMIFGGLAVPALYQHRVLFWGILGALAMRGAMIAAGAQLIASFHWVLAVFGVFLILTAVKMLFLKTGHSDPERSAVVRLTRRLVPVTSGYHGPRFAVRAGRPESRAPATPSGPDVRDEVVERARPDALLLTPLAIALVLVETTDLIFAVDSIPAIFAITADPFLVFTSNVFAILGLRSLYFAVAGMVTRFRYLKVALAAVLLIVGVKMLAAEHLKSTLGESFGLYVLGLILVALAAGVGASLLSAPNAEPSEATPNTRPDGVGA
jgi:tellurite resistance protein TerC